MEIYISTDIETNGPSPGHFSMLSFGSVAFTLDKKILSTFTRNLELLPGAGENPATMAWWQNQGEAWQACRQNLVSPQEAMQEYAAWLKSFSTQLVFVAHPVSFDYSFILWYLWEFAQENPFGPIAAHALDIASYSAAVLKRPVTQSWKKCMPDHWIDADYPHTHVALDDALGHALVLCNMVAENDTGSG